MQVLGQEKASGMGMNERTMYTYLYHASMYIYIHKYSCNPNRIDYTIFLCQGFSKKENVE